MEIYGRIKSIGETASFGAAGFRKRDLIVTTDEQYPQHLQVEFTQDKCDLLNSYKAGEAVKVSINLRGREWVNPQGETKYFNSIQGWRIERNGTAPAPSAAGRENSAADQYVNSHKEEEHDDLPF